MRNLTTSILVLTGLTLAGCQHYRVTDPQTGKSYYTRCVTRHIGGAVSFKDARTEDKVTLQNSQIDKISDEAYDQGVRNPSPPVQK